MAKKKIPLILVVPAVVLGLHVYHNIHGHNVGIGKAGDMMPFLLGGQYAHNLFLNLAGYCTLDTDIPRFHFCGIRS